MDLSIIIINFNTREVLKNCLDSIGRYAPELDYEIVAVDNASTDGSVEMLRREFPGVRVIANADNRGFSKANNQGIAAAAGRHILLLNSDTLLFDRSLKNVFDYMEANSGVGVAGCKVLNKDKTLQFSCGHDPNVLTELVFFTKTIIKDFWDPVTFWKFMKYWDHNSLKDVDWLSGCFLWVRREVFERAGLLDEDFFMYYEDSEFCRRVRRQTDYRVVYYPHAAIIHLGQMSADPEKFILVKNCFESAVKYFKKCSSKLSAWDFEHSCRFYWMLEQAVFFVFGLHPKCRQKYRMLKELLNA